MFSSLTKSRFYTKCKSLLKMTKTRLDALKKKKNAVAKYLKNDVVDLLRTGLDYNAYNRAEGLLVEFNTVKCYDFIDQFCSCIMTNLSEIDKQGECPESCKEAVQSLIYVAARLAEFPELRDLRSVFAEKYGTSLEAYVSKEFVETLSPKPATKEMKIQLLHDVAQEFSMEWNPKSLEQKLFVPPVAQCGSNDTNNERVDLPKGNVTEKKYSCKQQSSSEEEAVSTGWIDSTDRESLQVSLSSAGSVSEDEVETKGQSYRSIPPPYFRSNQKKEEAEEEAPKSRSNNKCDSVEKVKPQPRSVRRRPSNRQEPADDGEEVSSIDKPLKPPPGREKIGVVDQVKVTDFKRDSRTLRSANDDNQSDEEEKIMDELLQHYSKKDSHYEVSDKPRSYVKFPLSRQSNSDSTEPARLRSTKSGPPVSPNSGIPTKDDTKTRHARAFSVQAGHVHPNLPDYDDLAARIAALRGR